MEGIILIGVHYMSKFIAIFYCYF